MKPKLRIDVKLANAYAEGMHSTGCNIRKKTVKHSPLSKSASIHELIEAIREHNVSEVETCDMCIEQRSIKLGE